MANTGMHYCTHFYGSGCSVAVTTVISSRYRGDVPTFWARSLGTRKNDSTERSRARRIPFRRPFSGGDASCFVFAFFFVAGEVFWGAFTVQHIHTYLRPPLFAPPSQPLWSGRHCCYCYYRCCFGQAVPESENSFALRLPLAKPWLGLRDKELSEASGIEGGVFVHVNGFIGGNASKDGAMAMASKSLELAAAESKSTSSST